MWGHGDDQVYPGVGRVPRAKKRSMGIGGDTQRGMREDRG